LQFLKFEGNWNMNSGNFEKQANNPSQTNPPQYQPQHAPVYVATQTNQPQYLPQQAPPQFGGPAYPNTQQPICAQPINAQPVQMAIAVPFVTQQAYPQGQLQYGGQNPYGMQNQTIMMGRPGQQMILVTNNPPPGLDKPSNHMCLALVSFICCIWPIGLCALCMSCRVDSLWAQGNYAGAQQASRLAFQLALASIISGAILVIIASVAKK